MTPRSIPGRGAGHVSPEVSRGTSCATPGHAALDVRVVDPILNVPRARLRPDRRLVPAGPGPTAPCEKAGLAVCWAANVAGGHRRPIDAMHMSTPARIGKYTIIRPIGEGACTRILEAASADAPDRHVVVKVLRNGLPERATHWFDHLACTMIQLHHPGIVPCLEFGYWRESPYLVTPRIDGRDLREVLMHEGSLSPARVATIVREAAGALDHAHGRGTVHGNLHPGHILLDRDERIWLVGFAELGPLRPADHLVGNPHHLAPEQFVSSGISPATDIYALAEVAYRCLSGHYPFATTGPELLRQKHDGPVPAIREVRPELSADVEAVLLRAMAIQPAERFSTAGELAQELTRSLTGPN